MKILAVSDVESRFIWDHFDPAVFKGVDLIVSCGDLKASYLSYLVTMIPAPLFYVHGNHDTSYSVHPPEGCTCIDGKVLEYKGLRIAGIGGCRGTQPDAFQFSEEQMWKRVKKLESCIRKKKGVDIFVTHAPPLGIGDGQDFFHRGFDAFVYLNETYQPLYHFFGHRHLSGSPVNNRAVYHMGGTTMINATGYRIVDTELAHGCAAGSP